MLFLKESLPKIEIANQTNGDEPSDTSIEMTSLMDTESESNQITESNVDNTDQLLNSFNSDSQLLLNVHVDVPVNRCRKYHRLKRTITRYMNPLALGRSMIRMQQEQWMLCFWCCYKERQHSRRNMTTRLLLTDFGSKILKNMKQIAKAMFDHLVILSILLYVILGFVDITLQEVHLVTT